jgi:hypothetical protein
MFKKINIAALIAVLAAVIIAATASAETPAARWLTDRDPNHRMLIGKVLEIGSSKFTAEGLNGEVHTILVTDETVFRTRGEAAGESEEASFADLKTGMYIGVYNHEDSAGQFSARLVVLLPEDFDPSNFKVRRAVGEVAMVTVGGGFFKLDTRTGDTLTVTVDENTRYAGGLDSLEDLEQGEKVGVLLLEQEDGELLAKAVVGSQIERPRFEKQGGKLTGIDGQQITLTGRKGQTYTYTITDETRFASRDGKVKGLNDLELEMIVIVVFDSGSGENIARAVLVGDGALLNLERVHGEVHNTANDKVTVTTDEGTLTFVVGENTRIRGRQVDGLEDLEKGMKVIVIFETQDDGTLLAKGILAGGLFEKP